MGAQLIEADALLFQAQLISQPVLHQIGMEGLLVEVTRKRGDDAEGQSGSIEPLLQAGDGVHSLMQNGQNQRGLVFPGQTEQKVVPCPPYTQPGKQVVPVSEGAFPKGRLGGSRFDPGDIVAALVLPPGLHGVADDTAQVGHCAAGKDVGARHFFDSAASACSSSSLMLPSVSSPRWASARRLASNALSSRNA